MASSEPARTNQPERADQQPTAAPKPGRPPRWLWLVLVGAALLGLALGAGVVLRGRSLAPNAPAETVSRPTFVIGATASPLPRAVPSPVTAPSAAATDYVVQPGDTLRSIAQNVYGDPEPWPRIYAANRELIGPDPDALETGMRLRIP